MILKISIRLLSFLTLFVAVVFAENHPKCGLNGPRPPLVQQSLNSTFEDFEADYPENPENDLGIVGGREARAHKYPWHAQLLISYGDPGHLRTALCSCSILNSLWVLTAAHCLFDHKNVMVSRKSIKFTGGIHTYSGNTESKKSKRKVAAMHIHEHYDDHSPTSEDDLALLRLDKPLKLDSSSRHLGTICLPAKGKDYTGSKCIVTGWGQVSETVEHSDTLRQLKLKVLRQAKCVEKWDDFVADKMLCAFRKDGAGVCDGDSGGPLVCYEQQTKQWFQAGIVSTSEAHCATEIITHPSVFTKVDHYVDWIWHTIDKN